MDDFESRAALSLALDGAASDLPASDPAASDPPAADPIAPRDRYQLGPLLGRGGMGQVTAAYDKVLGRDVALKEIREPTPALEARFRREARLTAELDHPGIVPVYDAGRTGDGRLFYTMRLVRGQTLRALLGRAPASARDRVRLVAHLRDAARAVGHAHARGVVHRDLKPENVMVGGQGDVQVADWGLAIRVGEPDGARGGVIGTPGYIAPEVTAGAPWSPRADVWALGRILDQLLGDGADAPPELRAIATRARGPVEDRYLDASELAEDLARWLDGRPVLAHPYTRAELIARFVRAFRVPLALASVGLAIAGTIIALAWRDAAAERRAARDAEATLLITQARQALQVGAVPEALVMAAHSHELRASPAALGVMAQARTSLWPQLVSARPLRCDRVIPGPDAARWLCVNPTGSALESETTAAPIAGLVLRAAFSPGGRQLAMIIKGRGLVVRDIASGAEAVLDAQPVDSGRLIVGVDDAGTHAFTANGGWVRLATPSGVRECSVDPAVDPAYQLIELDGAGLLLAGESGAHWTRCDAAGRAAVDLPAIGSASSNDVLTSVVAIAPRIWLRGTTEGGIDQLEPGQATRAIARLPRAAAVERIADGGDGLVWVQQSKGGPLLVARGSGEVVAALPELDRGPIVRRADGTVVSFGRTRRAVWRLEGERAITTHAFERGGADLIVAPSGAVYFLGSHGTLARIEAHGDAVTSAHVGAGVLRGGVVDVAERVLWIPTAQASAALRELDARTLEPRRSAPGVLGKRLGWRTPTTLWITGFGDLATFDVGTLIATPLAVTGGASEPRREWPSASPLADGGWLLDELGTIWRLDAHGMRAIATRSGALLVAGTADRIVVADRTALSTLDAGGRELARAPLPTEPTALAIAADSRTAAVGFLDGTMSVWSVDDLRDTIDFAAHGERVSAIAFGAAGDVYSASWDHSLVHAAPGPAIDAAAAEARFGLTLAAATAPDMRR